MPAIYIVYHLNRRSQEGLVIACPPSLICKLPEFGNIAPQSIYFAGFTQRIQFTAFYREVKVFEPMCSVFYCLLFFM